VKKHFLVGFLLLFPMSGFADLRETVAQGPRVLVLYDGPDKVDNPGRLDALYLANLLGHFTTRRTVISLESYKAGQWKSYDAIFSIIFQRKYDVPSAFLADTPQITKPFCWLGNQTGQLNRYGTLRQHGLSFIGFSDKVKLNRVTYHGRTVVKGDSETNEVRIDDPRRAQEIATVSGPGGQKMPYIVRSLENGQPGSWWLVADSPFSYSSENDRYLVFADVLHDVLGIQHAETHPALLRIEDLNASSVPSEMKATLDVIRKFHIPFSFGFVPVYVNPHERTEFRLTDKPDVLSMLKTYVAAGGTPILHGYTHQYRGVTTDDYEFWDDLGDRAVRGDSKMFASHRMEEAVKESMSAGLYPAIWETPHYAASDLDYRAFHGYFSTMWERRQVAGRLGTDQFFPYPVIDILGQSIIPETLAYIPREDPRAEPLLDNAEAERVVRDGYASFFYHPFLNPDLLRQMIEGIQKRGFTFVDVRQFPNRAQIPGRVISQVGGSFTITGHGRYLDEKVLTATGKERRQRTVLVAQDQPVERTVSLSAGETYVAYRQDVPPPAWYQKFFRGAKGDVSIFQRRWETVFPIRNLSEPVKTLLLANGKATGAEASDQESFESLLGSMGYDVERIEYTGLIDEDFGPFTLLVIPQAAARGFDEEDVQKVLTAVQHGLMLITDGPSPLSDALGIQLGDAFQVENLQDHLFTDQDTHWPDHPSVPWIQAPSAESLHVYYSDRDLGRPLVVGGTRGEGRFLYYAPLFDPQSGMGYSRFPNLPELLINEYHLNPMLKRRGADVYFDPGYRPSISIEVLAKMWKRYGIRAVHVAAWSFYDKWSYDYARLIKVAHQNGILVYAWFEWPHVSQRFWDAHPQWREKTAILTDAHADWRLHMNFQNPDCLKAVLSDAAALLKANDWDGINLGEFTFDSPSGIERPDAMTPFNPQARAEFMRLNGFDPVELFKTASPNYWRANPSALETFYAYRKDVNERLLDVILKNFEDLKKKTNRPMETVVTILDALQHPELQNALGYDIMREIALINRYGATLQAEDPASEWTKSPDRYRLMGNRYDKVSLKKPYMIDINVLAVHPSNQVGFATPKPTGAEMFQLWKAASTPTGRVCLYSESSVNEQDWEILGYGMAAQATIQKEGDGWLVRTPFTVQAELGRDARKLRLDGEPWFCVQNGDVWVPPGEHHISFARTKTRWFDTSSLDTHLLSLSGELLGSQRTRRGLEVEYRALQRCILVFDKLPLKVYLDGESYRTSSLKGDDGFTIITPPGQHHVRVITESALLYFVEFTSLVSASLIVLFGLASSGLLVLLFVLTAIHRQIRKWVPMLRRKRGHQARRRNS
jgi:peptidoglycan/xylan/chitin deacetylase (PgdA/CDA1 family)